MSETPVAGQASADNRLTIRAVLRTDVGRVRSENQDFGSLTVPEEERDGRLMIVADGMGGHRGGATASRLAAETVKQHFLTSEAADVGEVLRKALAQANARIYSEAQANADLRGMGTTTSAFVARGGQGWLAHVGDSRIYRIRGQEMKQLTQDHSLVASMVREGLLTEEEAENHPRRNVLQRSMGVSEDVEIDVLGPFDLQEGDTFVICSDGLHGVVREEEIRQIASLPVDDAADEYVRRALDRGAPDNVTVIVARVEREGGFDPDMTMVDAQDRALYDETIREPGPHGKAAPPPRRSLSVVKWTLIFLLLLGSAGAGIFWGQQQGFARKAQSSSR